MVNLVNILVICANYENNFAAVKVRNEVNSWFCIDSGVKHGCVLFQLIWIILLDFVLRNTVKAMEEHRIKWECKTLLGLGYAGDLSVLDESICKLMNPWRL